MEEKTPFNLEIELQRWKNQLRQSPEFRPSDIEELECHLRDGIRDLRLLGLMEEEALVIAMRRIGSSSALASEFGRINGPTIWIDRLLWMLLGWVFISTMLGMVSPIIIAIGQFNRGAPAMFPFAVALLGASPFIVMGMVLRSLMRSDGNVPRVMTRLLCKPIKLSLMFLLIQMLPVALSTLLVWPQQIGMYGNVVRVVLALIVALFISILARKRQQGSPVVA